MDPSRGETSPAPISISPLARLLSHSCDWERFQWFAMQDVPQHVTPVLNRDRFSSCNGPQSRRNITALHSVSPRPRLLSQSCDPPGEISVVHNALPGMANTRPGVSETHHSVSPLLRLLSQSCDPPGAIPVVTNAFPSTQRRKRRC